jgi:hypothetical protein
MNWKGCGWKPSCIILLFVKPQDTLNLEEYLNPGTSRIRNMNVIPLFFLLLLLLLLLLLTLQPYVGFCPLHQVISDISVYDDVTQISRF